MADDTQLEVGALTEWDALKEVIVGGYEAHWPVLTPTELSLIRASHSAEVLATFERTQGTSMEESQPDMFERVKKEVSDLVATFEKLGVAVRQPRSATPDDIALYGTDRGLVPWFPRDMFITHKNKIIFASLGLPMLQKSQQLFYEIMDAKANSSEITEIVGVPFPNFGVKEGAKVNNNVPLLDGGDVLFFGDHLFVGVSEQKNMGSNKRGAAWLQTVLGPDYAVTACPLHEKFFHLDLVMSAPREGLVMVAPEAFIEGVPSYFDDWDKIEVTGEQAMNGCLNGLPVDSENYVLGINERDDMKWLIAQIEERGIKVHPVWFDEHNLRDGSIRCATQQLLRIPGE
jgi:N-dimethylarginine dimethylaminohydrolase